jgi:hypothetical protein
MEVNQDNCFKFIAPFTMIVSGATMSGKTELVKIIILNAEKIIKPKPVNIVISYSVDQTEYKELQNYGVKLVHGLEFEIEDFLPHTPSLLIIDDQMDDAITNEKINELFTKGVHHRNVSVIILQQNVFPQGKYGRTIRLNAQYLILMRSPMFLSQVMSLGRQLFPGKSKFLLDAYKKATAEPYSYLVVNLHPLCDDQLRITEGLFSESEKIIYLPK